MTRMIALGLLLAAGALIWARPAPAYVVGLCNGVPVERASLIPQFRAQSLAGADPTGEFDEAIGIFNANPTNMSYAANVQFLLDYAVGLNNGNDEVWSFLETTDADLFNGDQFAAVAFYYLDGCDIVEGDVVFNLARQWNTSDGKADYNAYGDDGSDLAVPPIAVHELGHTVGFGHDCSTYNVMGNATRHFWANGPNAASYLGEGVVAGLVDVYSDDGPATLQAPDVAVTHWRYDSCDSGGYSVHRRTSVFGTDGMVLDTVGGEPEPRFVAAAGQTVEAAFTFENLGNTLEEGVEIGFYWSANDTITTLDRRLGGASLDFVRNDPDTRRFTVALPIDLAQGDGYLGVIVDETDDIDESFEANNASYVGMRIDGTDLDGDGEPDDAAVHYRYAAKVVCGRQEDDADLRLRPGRYATTVNVFNPDLETTRFDKRLAVSYPPDPQLQGDTFELGFDTLDPLRALETNCDTLIREAFGGAAPAPYFEGFVVVTSPRSLDVTAVYTSSGLALAGLSAAGSAAPGGAYAGRPACKKVPYCGSCCAPCCPGNGNGNGDGNGGGGGLTLAAPTIDVEQIREREIEPPPPPGTDGPDLVPERPFEGDGTQPPNDGYCLSLTDFPFDAATQIRVRVRNQGSDGANPSVARVRFGRDGAAPPPASGEPSANTMPLDPGGADTHDIAIPEACYGPPGTPCRFRITVDAASDVDETDESNNSVDGLCASFAPPG